MYFTNSEIELACAGSLASWTQPWGILGTEVQRETGGGTKGSRNVGKLDRGQEWGMGTCFHFQRVSKAGSIGSNVISYWVMRNSDS